LDDHKYESYLYQRERVKEYLEEVFVRQCQVDQNEADDLIAQYTRIAKDENMIIFSGDKDLTQLIGENVMLVSTVTKTYSKKGDLIHFKNIDIPNNNCLSLQDRKSTRLNSSHITISYAVFCLKTKQDRKDQTR